MNVGVILAAGRSSRFDNLVPKQLYLLNGKPLINYSIDILSQTLDDVIIVTNSDCYSKIITDKKVLINDVDDRIESIKVALDYLENNEFDNILIHDAARPFILSEHIQNLIDSQKVNSHSQYYLPIVNGLAHYSNGVWNIPDRSDFIQLCSPQMTNFDLFKDLFRGKIQTGIECEILPLINKIGYSFNLIEGQNKFLKKLTTIDDVD